MGTEVAISFTTLRAQLENEKSSLYKIDENIKKIVQTTGRFTNDRLNNAGEYPRGNNRTGGRNSFGDSANSFNKIDDHFGKRKQETKTVFSRLSARAGSAGEEEAAPKRARVPSAVSRELPSRAAVLRAQGGDEQARTRNRRIFGSLLGTLHKFKQEEIVLQTKEEKKAQVERKIEEQARLEKEREQKERKTLFAEREHKRATIKALEAKMGRVQEFERWEESQAHLGNYILTRTKPHMYWIPKKMNDKAEEKLISSRKYHEKCMSKKREELQEELQRIEQRCLRQRGPGAKENDPETLDDKTHVKNGQDITEEKGDEEERGRKRDKFATDIEKDESDNDDPHDYVSVKEEVDKEIKDEVTTQPAESKLDSSVQSSECDIPPVPGETADVTMVSVASLDAASVSAASLDAASVSVASLDAASVSVASLDAASVSAASLDAASASVASLDAASVSVASLDAASVSAASPDAGTVSAASLAAAAPEPSEQSEAEPPLEASQHSQQ